MFTAVPQRPTGLIERHLDRYFWLFQDYDGTEMESEDIFIMLDKRMMPDCIAYTTTCPLQLSVTHISYTQSATRHVTHIHTTTHIRINSRTPTWSGHPACRVERRAGEGSAVAAATRAAAAAPHPGGGDDGSEGGGVEGGGSAPDGGEGE